MKSIKEKLPALIGATIFLLLIGFVFYNMEYSNLTYYTKIDNKKVNELNTSDNMKYEYKLVSYDEKGKKKKVTFKTSRVLKDDAYLKLTYKYISGVNKWEEVKYENLPNKVKQKYSNN